MHWHLARARLGHAGPVPAPAAARRARRHAPAIEERRRRIHRQATGRLQGGAGAGAGRCRPAVLPLGSEFSGRWRGALCVCTARNGPGPDPSALPAAAAAWAAEVGGRGSEIARFQVRNCSISGPESLDFRSGIARCSVEHCASLDG